MRFLFSKEKGGLKQAFEVGCVKHELQGQGCGKLKPIISSVLFMRFGGFRDMKLPFDRLAL